MKFNLSDKERTYRGSKVIDSFNVKEFINLQEKLVELVINKKITHKEFVKRWCKLTGEKLI